MNEILYDILEAWIPYKLPKWIMGLAISLSLGTLIPVERLQVVGLYLSPEEMTLAHISGIPWLLLSALAISHVLVVHEMKKSVAFRNSDKIENVLRVALNVVKDRAHVSTSSTDELKSVFNNNKFYLRCTLSRKIEAILDKLCRLVCYEEELKDSCLSELDKVRRKDILAELNKDETFLEKELHKLLA